MAPTDEALRRLEENKEYQKTMECMSEGSEGEMQQKVQNYLACIQKLSWMNKEQFEHMESGVWLRQKEKEGTNSKNTGGGESKSNGGKISKGKPQNRSKSSKISKCVSAKNNSWRRRERKTQANQR